MKKIITICLFISLSGCAALSYNSRIGMGEEEFKKTHFGASLYSFSEGKSVYKINLTDEGKQFYYFQDGKLIGMETIERVPDVVIQHKKEDSQ
ncbi:hypothetical protein [Rufibacter quisquiliarum]|uniref:Lipoprotein n=1 Tax=Rufibacter quisquiliarum TaxID=1549639 RepID=A0A839GCI1_9BACT|nr:hypothetical protein [Rufibacter quisquiliarum]MBA9077294.1 hypothetical protein [Rufibacter quisquiliarum]